MSRPSEQQVVASRPSRPVSIDDVARTAGYSTTTVSRVLNRRPDVAPGTRQAILKTISDLGYVRMSAAVAVSLGRNSILEAVIGDSATYGAFTVLRGILDITGQRGYHLIVRFATPARDDQIPPTTVAAAGSVVLWLSKDLVGVAEECMRTGPVVLIQPEVRLSGTTAVYLDSFRAGYDATLHLIQLGHRRIALLSGPMGWLGLERQREGFLTCLRDASLESHAIVHESDTTEEGGKREIRELLRLPAPPTAVITSSDLTALGIIAAAHEDGFSIPRDLSVVGYDDVDLAGVVSLTAPRAALRRVSVHAVELLMNLIEGRPTPKEAVVETDLAARASTAPPKRD